MIVSTVPDELSAEPGSRVVGTETWWTRSSSGGRSEFCHPLPGNVHRTVLPIVPLSADRLDPGP